MMSKERGSNRRIIFTRSVNHMQSTIFFLYTLLVCSSLLYCSARDDITANSPLRDQGQTLVSAAKIFELGFFTPSRNSSNRRYVGIWYYKSNPKIIVWVANRDSPLSDYGGVFAIADDGLNVVDLNGTTYWSTRVQKSLSTHRVAKLEDSGNLVLYDDQQATSLWESFKNPTDTFLPGMKMGESLKLTSWNSKDDPASGNFTFNQDQQVEYIMKRSIRYWKSSESGKFFSSDEMPSAISYFLSNFSKIPKPSDSSKLKVSSPLGNNDQRKPLVLNITSPSGNNNQTQRLVMNFTGEIEYWSSASMQDWSLLWKEPRDRCRVDNACGNFGICNSNNLECKCLPGFNSSFPEKWDYGDYSGGCTRNSKICGKDYFLSLKITKVGNPDTTFGDKNESECRKECLDNCLCNAYSYYVAQDKARGIDNITCWIWTDDLKNLQEEYSIGSRDLFVRVALSDIKSTSRNCDTCGIHMIPYPLSTGQNCGDPMYSSFQCNTSTGQLSFKAPSGTYYVTSIDPKAQTFVIQVKDADNCNASHSRSKIPQLAQSLPFTVTGRCNPVLINSNSDSLSEAMDEVEIGWQPPREPTCTSSVGCKDWPHSNCSVSTDGGRR